MFKRIIFCHSAKVIEQFNPPMFEIWSNFVHSATNHPSHLNQTISEECARALGDGALKRLLGFTNLDSAATVLRVARVQDYRLRCVRVDRYFELIEQVESIDLNSHSFGGKTVIAVEGLEGSGKTALAKCISNRCDGVEILSCETHPTIRLVYEVFEEMPEPIRQAFHFLNNYILALEVLSSSKEAFIIEGYHHAVCCRNVCEHAANETAISHLPNSVFAWPYDLPQPALVR